MYFLLLIYILIFLNEQYFLACLVPLYWIHSCSLVFRCEESVRLELRAYILKVLFWFGFVGNPRMLPIQRYWKLILFNWVLFINIKILCDFYFLGEPQKNKFSAGVSFKSGLFLSINPFTQGVVNQMSNLIYLFYLPTWLVWMPHRFSPHACKNIPQFSVSVFNKFQHQFVNAKTKVSLCYPYKL